MTDFLHGAEVLDFTDGARTVTTVASAVIGIVGTAPNSQPEVKATLAAGLVASNNAITYTAKLAGALGNKISLTLVDPKANTQALAVSVSGRDITVKLATSGAGAITTTATLLMAAITANAAALALVGTASTGASTGAGVVTAMAKTALTGGVDDAFPLNTPVLVAGNQKQAALLGSLGTLPDAMDSIFDQAGAIVIVVRVAVGTTDTETTANIIGGVDSTTGNYNGVHAFLGAESITGQPPRILIAPGFTHQRTTTANAVVAELVGIAQRLRAVIIADGPSTTDADAIIYAGDFGSERIYLADPFVQKLDGNGEPMLAYTSAHVAGLQCQIDNAEGFWVSPSNHVINGIIGTDRPIDYTMGDPASRANLLNAAKVATVIRQNGFRLWGNRTLSADPALAFLSVVRTRDLIDDSVLRGHQWAVDRNITKGYAEAVVESVNNYLRSLVTLGAILGGECWFDPDLNTQDQLADGHVFFDFDFTPSPNAERVTFRSHLTNKYLASLFSN